MSGPIIIANSVSNKVYVIAATLVINNSDKVRITTFMMSITGFNKGDVTSQFINYTKMKFKEYHIHGQPIVLEV